MAKGPGGYVREKERIDLVILDLIMPIMGGKDCLKKILTIDPQAKSHCQRLLG